MVTPNTIVKLYSGIPCDPTYQNVLQFDSVAEQNAYFANKIPVATYTDFQFLDGNRELRVKRNMENCYNINYVAYQNHRFGNKWFYAFVKNMEYASPESTKLFLEEDVWATWQFDLTFNPSFIVRETVSDDTIGANTVPENVELGPYVVSKQSDIQFFYNEIIIYATEALDDSWKASYQLGDSGGAVGKQVPIYNKVYASSDWNTAKGDLESFTQKGKTEAVLNIVYACGTPATKEFPALTTLYNARNNKLYTSPYVVAVAYTLGQSLELQYELWSKHAYSFKTDGGPNQKWVFTPLNYAGDEFALNYQLTVATTFPIPWTSNYYQNWAARNSASNIWGVVSGVTKGIMTAAVNPAVGIMGALDSVMGYVGKASEAKITPDQVHGNFGNAALDILNGYPAITMQCKCIRPEYAKIIDDYFSRFGYKVNRTKDIDLHNRENWDFVKTVDANIIGNCPAPVIERIKTMFNTGVTLWHTGNFDYGDLSNPII